MKKTSNTAKILGLQGDKVVSAEGIESARKRIYNKMQAADVIRSGCKSALVGQTERR